MKRTELETSANGDGRLALPCRACDQPAYLDEAVRLELNSPSLYVVQYLCPACGLEMARTLCPEETYVMHGPRKPRCNGTGSIPIGSAWANHHPSER